VTRRLIIIASLALMLASPTAHAAAGGPVPSNERTRMRVLLSPYAYVPASLPPSYIFIDWKHSYLDPSVCGQMLTVEFAAPGGDRQINWTSSRACTTTGRVACSATGYRGYAYGMFADRKATINGRRVYFSQGNHGSNAWTCLPLRTSYGLDYVEIGIWESNFITPTQAMQLVARARPA